MQNADLGFSYKGSELQALLGDEDFQNLDVGSWVNRYMEMICLLFRLY